MKYRVKGHIFRRLTSAIESLSASTDVTIRYRGVAADVDGRCSMYQSHRGVTYRPDLGVPGVWNSKHALMFDVPAEGQDPPSLRGADCRMLRQEWHYVYIPASLLEPLAQGFRQYFGRTPWQNETLVHAWVAMPKLSGWDGMGRPIYEEAAESEPQPEPDAPVLPPLESDTQ